MTTTDYDAPRRSIVDLDEDSLEELQGRPASAQSPIVDLDEAEEAEAFELPDGAQAGVVGLVEGQQRSGDDEYPAGAVRRPTTGGPARRRPARLSPNPPMLLGFGRVGT